MNESDYYQYRKYKTKYKNLKNTYIEHKNTKKLTLNTMSGGSVLNILKSYLETTDAQSCMILQNSQVIFEYGITSKPERVASVRKSILAILYGMYDINLTQTLAELNIDDKIKLSDNEKKATIADILTARSGVYHAPGNQYKTQIPPIRESHSHGTYWYYNNWDFNVAGTIFEQITKVNIYDALYSLGQIIDFKDYSADDAKTQKQMTADIDITKVPSFHQPYHFNLSARDMAQIGLLMLNNGKYNTKQVVSEDWVKRITSLVTSYEEVYTTDPSRKIIYGYGYMWWVYDTKNQNDPLYGAYRAQGLDEQYITVIPKTKIVIVAKGKIKDGKNISNIDTNKTNIPINMAFIERLINSFYY